MLEKEHVYHFNTGQDINMFFALHAMVKVI